MPQTPGSEWLINIKASASGTGQRNLSRVRWATPRAGVPTVYDRLPLVRVVSRGPSADARRLTMPQNALRYLRAYRFYHVEREFAGFDLSGHVHMSWSDEAGMNKSFRLCNGSWQFVQIESRSTCIYENQTAAT